MGELMVVLPGRAPQDWKSHSRFDQTLVRPSLQDQPEDVPDGLGV